MEESPIPDTPTSQQNPAFVPQAPTQLAPQSIFTGLHNPAILDFDDWDDQLVVPPAQPPAQPASLVTFVPPGDSCFGSSSDDEMPLQDLKFVKGCAQHGDAVDFTRRFAREVRKCRMSDYSLLKQVYACASICDEVTEATIEAQIEVGTFPHGPAARNRRFERGAVAADANANQVELANQAVGTLTQFLDWFRVEFRRQDAVVEAREQVEHKLGQTLSLDQHWLRFSRYLELMPQGRNADGDLVANVTQPHAINHWLNSCSPALPTELEDAGYKPPRWHGKKQHTTLANGFASVRDCYEWMLNEEKPLAAESRDIGLKQHWVDFPGRSAAGMTKAQQKKLVSSVALDESMLTPASLRALMAQCVDSAVAKFGARQEQKFGDRLTGGGPTTRLFRQLVQPKAIQTIFSKCSDRCFDGSTATSAS